MTVVGERAQRLIELLTGDSTLRAQLGEALCPTATEIEQIRSVVHAAERMRLPTNIKEDFYFTTTAVAAGVKPELYINAVQRACLLHVIRTSTRSRVLPLVLRFGLGFTAEEVRLVFGNHNNAGLLILDHRFKACSRLWPGAPCRCESRVGYALAQGVVTEDDAAPPCRRPHSIVELLQSLRES